MRILILGGDGMLGHQLMVSLCSRYELKTTLRQDISAYKQHELFNSENSYGGIDVRSLERLIEVLADFKPEVVINAVGIVKQRDEAKEWIPSIEINALLPHRLAVLCQGIGARLIHFSTDCIFSGEKGNYSESDPSDATDLYGKTKYLGEVNEANTITLRTSIIGRELSRHKSLLDWFLAQRNTVKGFTKAIYTGITTIEMAKVVEKILVEYPEATGIYHVSSDPISKYELLLLIKEKYKLDLKIIPDSSFCCDRSLDSSQFRKKFKYNPPDWATMIEELQLNDK